MTATELKQIRQIIREEVRLYAEGDPKQGQISADFMRKLEEVKRIRAEKEAKWRNQ